MPLWITGDRAGRARARLQDMVASLVLNTWVEERVNSHTNGLKSTSWFAWCWMSGYINDGIHIQQAKTCAEWWGGAADHEVLDDGRLQRLGRALARR